MKIFLKKKNIIISGLSSNSKRSKKKLYFLAIKGNKIDGEKFIDDAIDRGATVVVCSKSCNFESKDIFVIKKILDIFLSSNFKVLQK